MTFETNESQWKSLYIINIAGEIKGERFYRKLDFRGSNVCFECGAFTGGGIKLS